MRGLPVFFTALAEEDLDQIIKPVLRILHAAQDWTRSIRLGCMGSQAVGLVDEAAEPALHGQGFGGGGNMTSSWINPFTAQ
ncbi:MAG: hypothetical protein ABSD29_07465 [Verrucomicrobiota bacterium]|jgi:hypothetical protein